MPDSRPSTPLDYLLPLRPAADRILDIQTDDGAIAWFESGPWDPWNHVESAMALAVMGDLEAARQAYDYLHRTQRPDGAWLGVYGNAVPMQDAYHLSREPGPAFLDSNFCAYPIVGITQYYLLTGNLIQLRAWWPMIVSALNFVLSLQRSDGTIVWSAEALGTGEEDALLAGNASIAKSLECALFLAKSLGETRPDWHTAYRALASALRFKPELFDRRGTGTKFAMDWYYPVLSGTLDRAEAASRIRAKWDTFVVEGLGCRCVSDEPWVTVAETCELVMALLQIEAREEAFTLLQTIAAIQDEQGVYWMGWQFEEQIFWPRELPSWTQAAVILAYDAVYGTHRASQLLTRPCLQFP